MDCKEAELLSFKGCDCWIEVQLEVSDVPQEQVVEASAINVFINDLNDGSKCTLSTDDPKLEGLAD